MDLSSLKQLAADVLISVIERKGESVALFPSVGDTPLTKDQMRGLRDVFKAYGMPGKLLPDGTHLRGTIENHVCWLRRWLQANVTVCYAYSPHRLRPSRAPLMNLSPIVAEHPALCKALFPRDLTHPLVDRPVYLSEFLVAHKKFAQKKKKIQAKYERAFDDLVEEVATLGLEAKRQQINEWFNREKNTLSPFMWRGGKNTDIYEQSMCFIEKHTNEEIREAEKEWREARKPEKKSFHEVLSMLPQEAKDQRDTFENRWYRMMEENELDERREIDKAKNDWNRGSRLFDKQIRYSMLATFGFPPKCLPGLNFAALSTETLIECVKVIKKNFIRLASSKGVKSDRDVEEEISGLNALVQPVCYDHWENQFYRCLLLMAVRNYHSLLFLTHKSSGMRCIPRSLATLAHPSFSTEIRWAIDWKDKEQGIGKVIPCSKSCPQPDPRPQPGLIPPPPPTIEEVFDEEKVSSDGSDDGQQPKDQSITTEAGEPATETQVRDSDEDGDADPPHREGAQTKEQHVQKRRRRMTKEEVRRFEAEKAKNPDAYCAGNSCRNLRDDLKYRQCSKCRSRVQKSMSRMRSKHDRS